MAMGHDSFLWDMTDCYGTYLIPIQHDFFVVCAIKYRTPSRPPHNKSIGKKQNKYNITVPVVPTKHETHTNRKQREATSHVMSHSYAT